MNALVCLLLLIAYCVMRLSGPKLRDNTTAVTLPELAPVWNWASYVLVIIVMTLAAAAVVEGILFDMSCRAL